MKINYLKGLRVFLAILFFVPITLYFIDFSNKLPNSLHTLLHMQFVPALLGGMWGIILFLLLLTLFFGRIYCSVVCPAGILQDVLARFSGRGRKKNKYKRWFSYHKAYNWIRYILLGITILFFLFGSTGLLLLLDPYSNFGRIASNLFRPAVIWGNNLLADILTNMNNYSLYHITIQHITTYSFVASIIALMIFTFLSVLRGRLFCNTLCPVGALLSIVSRYSLFRISFDKEACNSCGNCERTCKSECIDSKAKTVDSSRCVDCFNCTSSCKKGGLKYRFVNPFSKKEGEKEINDRPFFSKTNSRRTFLATGVTLLATTPVIPAFASGKQKRMRRRGKHTPLIPPGGISLERFSEKCTGCHLCVVKCPNQILRPAGLEYGFEYMLKPRVVYDKAYCNYECTICSEVCPNHALKELTKDEKATTQVGIAHFEKDICVTYVDGTDCGASA